MQNPSHRPAIVIISHVNDWKSTRFGLIRIVIDSCMALWLNKKSVSHFIGKPLNNLARWNDVRKHVHAEDNVHSKRKKQTTDGRINGKWKFPRFDLIVFFCLFVQVRMKYSNESPAEALHLPEQKIRGSVCVFFSYSFPELFRTLYAFNWCIRIATLFGWLQCRKTTQREIIELLPLMNRLALNHIYISACVFTHQIV